MTINIIGSDNIKKYVFVKQQGYKDCACACLLMIIKYYNGSVSLEYLREITRTTKQGTNLYNLVEAANQMGFRAYGLKGNIESLQSSFLPVIAHGIVEQQYKHFIVIYQIDKKKKRLVIADPADQIKTISFDDFKKFSTGYYCILEIIKPLPKLNETKTFSHFILNNIFKNKKLLLTSFLFSFLFFLLQIVSCYYIQCIIDYVIPYKSLYNLVCISLWFLSFALLKNIFCYIKNKIAIVLSMKLDESLTVSTFNHILSLPYFYYKNHPSGEILSRIKDIKEISDMLSKSIVDILISSILIISTFFLLLFLDKIFVTIALVIVLLYLFIFFLLNMLIHVLNKNLHKEAGRLNHMLIEFFQLLETIKNLNIGKIIKIRFHLYYKKFLMNKTRLWNQYNQLELFTEILNTTSTILFLFTMAFLILHTEYSIGLIFTYQQVFCYFNEAFKSLIEASLEVKNSKLSFDRLKELYAIKQEKNKKHSVKSISIKGNITIKNLDFAYGKNKIFQALNLTIKKGEKVILYGPSGVGKSTLIKMILRFIDVDKKKIFIDGMDISDLDISLLRENICYLSQNEILITDSIYNNVTLYRNIDYEDFLKVCKITLLDEMLEKNLMNYDSLLEENGFNLSGGERQRILLARTILKNANIYIFDESLSEIDIASERKILKKLFYLYRDKTIIVISHRFDNRALFDRKIKLEKGCIYE